MKWLNKFLKKICSRSSGDGAPPWYEIAEKEIGTKEVAGEEHNDRILEYHTATTLKATQDEVPWCSAFANWVCREANLEGTNSAMARSWLSWGKALADPRVGCVVVLWRHSPSSVFGHVGFFVAKDDKTVFVLGGNQSNRVCIQGYPLERVLGYRWIKGA